MINNITFEYPIFLFLPIFYLICLRFCKQKRVSFIFSANHLISKVVAKKSLLLEFLKFLIVFFLSVALSSPIVEEDIRIDNTKGYEISLILDASGSMREHNKFSIVKDIVEDFLKKRKGDKIALSLFADFAYVAIPLTYDKRSIKRLLDRLEVGIAGTRRTALYEALFLSSNIFKNSKSKNKIAILLTDGMDNVGNIPLNVAIESSQKYGIKVYTIGVGGRGDFNAAVLSKIAKKTGGKFFEANSVERLKEIYKTIDELEKSEIKANKYLKKSYYYQYPLAFAFILLVILFLLLYRSGYDRV